MGREDPKASHVCEGWRAIDVMGQDRKPEREVGWNGEDKEFCEGCAAFEALQDKEKFGKQLEEKPQSLKRKKCESSAFHGS